MIAISLRPLDRDRIFRALRIQGKEKPGGDLDRLKLQISSCEEAVFQHSHPKAVYRIFPVKEVASILSGKDVFHLLEGCGEAVLMAVTLGAELERYLMRMEVMNMADAYIMDVCSSQAAEQAADDLEAMLRKFFLSEGRYLTNRFSPGYGDLPLSVQRPFLDMIDASRSIGLTLTASNLMVPRKSITAVMGISTSPKARILGGCIHCPLRTKCSFREHGEKCYE